jgi:hypothetical protein
MSVTQVFSVPGYSYCVIDSGAAPAFPTLSANSHIGYDTVVSGASNQMASVLGSEVNSSRPDWVEDQTSILNNPLSATIGYLNPS